MIITLTWLVAAMVAVVMYLHQKYSTFSKAGVNNLPVIPFFGHILWSFFKLENMIDAIMRNVSAFPEDKVVGQYDFLSPVYLVKDIEFIKKVTIRDFEHFVDRKSFAPETDPFFGRGLVMLKGDEWKEMRKSLTPAFTSFKISEMVPFMVEVGEEMIKHLHQKLKSSKKGYIDLNTKNLTTRYANDVIASCVFGLKVDSQSADNKFYVNSKEATNFTMIQIIKFFICKQLPSVGKMMNLQVSSINSTNYFSEVLLTAMKQREKYNIVRHDIINILLEVKKVKLVHDKKTDTDAGFATVAESNVGKKKSNRKWSDTDLVAQATFFLLAGIDTVSTAINFILHELAVNPEIQDKLAKEIKEHDAKNAGKLDFSSIQNMKYLDMVVKEGLRLYPPVAFVNRVCVKDYNFGRVNNTSTKDLIVRKGDVIAFAIWAFHRDPKLYPDPLMFDPERFSDENKHKIKPFSYMPFGLGPRSCIGARFALCELKLILYQLIRDMKVSPCDKTNIPVKWTKGINLNIYGGGWIRLQVRT